MGKEGEMADDVMRNKLRSFLNSKTYTHIMAKGFHYNGFLIFVDEFYVEIRDSKTDANVLIKIDSIDVVEEGKR